MLGTAAEPGTDMCSFTSRWCCRTAVIQQGRGQGDVTPSAMLVCVRWAAGVRGVPSPLPPAPPPHLGQDPAGKQMPWAPGALPSSLQAARSSWCAESSVSFCQQ